jgi:AcrR family transcriptional regulator
MQTAGGQSRSTRIAGGRAGHAPAVPKSRKGRARVSDIFQAARNVLLQRDYTQFSLRNVAAEAGMHLSNLQYYFPTRDDLVHQLLRDVASRYEDHYERLFRDLPADPAVRFAAIAHYLVEDIHELNTRRFFIQLWALLESSGDGGELLHELYARHIDKLAGYLADMNPATPAFLCRQRATLIAAQIEGMMLLLENAHTEPGAGTPPIEEEMHRQIMRIANGD